ITIEDGTLFQIPLMGELSQWLTRLYPGLGFATQTDFRTNYRIKDGAFHTEDAMLEGAMLSLKGKGDYFFDQRLDVVVQVQPMRDGIVAEAVRLATSPLTKLLEFKLAGTLREPKWRPLNLPKEMFLIFD
ncbi:MAG: AsmA-like C-terminal region-containing protein, partial [Verrucomicrobia bacterium]|nr:AsmA-like C-terminal region-containing protein [Verrucomicrobiota bacterium]